MCPVTDILLKLTGKASPLQLHPPRALYSVAAGVKDFIEHEHVQHMLLKTLGM